MFNSDENYFFSNFNNSKEQLLSLSSIYTLENNNMNNQNENINDIIIKDNYYNNDIRKENEKQFIFDKENENTGYDSKNKNVPPVNLQNLESNSIIINNSNYYVRKEAILTIYEWYREGDRDLKDCSFYDDLINLSEIETIKELRGSLNELFDREENLDYLDNIKIDVVDASDWVKIYDLDINNMFDDKTITKAKRLKIDKRGKIDNYYKYDVDGKIVIINISVDNKIKWFNCSCDNDKCSHLCKCLIDLSGKEV